MATQLISINSAQRQPGGTSSDFSVEVKGVTSHVTSLRALIINIPKTYYNVSAALGNNTLGFRLRATSATVTIPDGAYGATNLSNTIVALMTAIVDAGWTMTVDPATLLTTIAGTNGAFTLFFSAAGSIGPTLGYAAADIVGTTSATATSVINLDSPLSLYITVGPYGDTSGSTSYASGYNFQSHLGRCLSRQPNHMEV